MKKMYILLIALVASMGNTVVHCVTDLTTQEVIQILEKADPEKRQAILEEKINQTTAQLDETLRDMALDGSGIKKIADIPAYINTLNTLMKLGNAYGLAIDAALKQSAVALMNEAKEVVNQSDSKIPESAPIQSLQPNVDPYAPSAPPLEDK